jgi:hypothetical protein
MNETYQKVRERIAELCKEAGVDLCLKDFEGECIEYRDPTLSDVLLAIDRKYRGNQFATVASNGWVHFGMERTFWNHRHNSLRDQSPEVWEWLYNVLSKYYERTNTTRNNV